MDNEYQPKYLHVPVNSSSTVSEGDESVSPRAVHYESAELRRIGKQCGSRLPPANAVQAMFLYEMQRETELECLFQGHMFRLARSEDDSHKQARRIEAIEAQMAQMEKQLASRDIQDRAAQSKVALNVQQGKLDRCSGRVDALEGTFAVLDSQLQAMRTIQDATPPITTCAAPDSGLDIIKEELDVLFDDRDGILRMLDEMKDRITKLEDNVRALTLQGTTSKSSRSSSPQILPVQTPTGKAVDLAVQKGHAHVALSRTASSVRNFSPGKQWGQ